MSDKKYALGGLFDIESLSKEQEQNIFTAIRSGDEALKTRLIQSLIGKVSEVADGCVSSAVDFSELFSAGRAELVEAAEDFDYNAEERFGAYLMRRLSARMQYCYDHLATFLPIDYRAVQLHDRYEEALLVLYPNIFDREKESVHDDELIADYLGVTLSELRAARSEYDMCKIISLQTPIKLDKSLPDDYEDDDIDNHSPLIELIVDPKTDNQAAELLDRLMDCLSDEERYVVCARVGALSVPERTDEQIASKLGVEACTVEALYNAAIDKIRMAG